MEKVAATERDGSAGHDDAQPGINDDASTRIASSTARLNDATAANVQLWVPIRKLPLDFGYASTATDPTSTNW